MTVFSPDHKYRYVLTRTLTYPRVMEGLDGDVMGVTPYQPTHSANFIMLNPSTADEIEDDPTIRRCLAFTKQWGCGKLTVTNLFAFRATEPKAMKAEALPVGPENDAHLVRVANEATLVVLAWGAHGSFLARDEDVLKLLPRPVYYLGLTKEGYPRHPLYLPSDSKLKQWDL